MAQQIVVWIIVVIAAVFVARNLWRQYRRTDDGCAGCTGCDLGKATDQCESCPSVEIRERDS